MKKSRVVKKFLDELKDTPNVSIVCRKIGISRNSVYRWINKDPELKKLLEECLLMGIENINDLAESKLINHINNGDFKSIKYWLSNRKKEYITPRKPINPIKEYLEDKIDKIQITIVENKDNKTIQRKID